MFCFVFLSFFCQIKWTCVSVSISFLDGCFFPFLPQKKFSSTLIQIEAESVAPKRSSVKPVREENGLSICSAPLKRSSRDRGYVQALRVEIAMT